MNMLLSCELWNPILNPIYTFALIVIARTVRSESYLEDQYLMYFFMLNPMVASVLLKTYRKYFFKALYCMATNFKKIFFPMMVFLYFQSYFKTENIYIFNQEALLTTISELIWCFELCHNKNYPVPSFSMSRRVKNFLHFHCPCILL